MCTPCALRVVTAFLGLAACRPTTNTPGEHPAHPPIVSPTSAASAEAPSASAAPPPAASATAPPSKAARRIEITDVQLADPVAGQQPGAVHSKGTVIALAHGKTARGSVGVVEIDVASGTEVKRSKITLEGRAHLVREDDTIHVAAATASSFVWATMNLALEETRRVTPKASPATESDFEAFAVLRANAVVVSSARGATAAVLDGQGKTLARHDCKANVPARGFVEVVRAGGLVIVDGLVADASPVACAFRSDGSGTPIRKKLAPFITLFAHDGVAYANGAEIHRLDGSLDARGPAIADPRSCRDPHSSCAARCASGVTGEATAQRLMMSDVLVLRTVACCGGAPGGLFFCDATAQVTAER